jgi:hypothetical protein
MKQVFSEPVRQAKRKAKGCLLRLVRRCLEKKGKKSRRRRSLLKSSRRGLAWDPVLAGDQAVIGVIMSKAGQDGDGTVGGTAVRDAAGVASGVIAAEAISVVVGQARREVHLAVSSRAAVQVVGSAVIKGVAVLVVIEAVVLPADFLAALVPVAAPAGVRADPWAGDPAVASHPVVASVEVGSVVALAAEWDRVVVLRRVVDHRAVLFLVEVRANDQGLSTATSGIAAVIRQTWGRSCGSLGRSESFEVGKKSQRSRFLQATEGWQTARGDDPPGGPGDSGHPFLGGPHVG